MFDHIFTFNAIKTNVNLVIEATQEITRLAEEMAAGNLTIDVKPRSDQDTLM
jgi:methyl-accepting chemotaxis protein